MPPKLDFNFNQSLSFPGLSRSGILIGRTLLRINIFDELDDTTHEDFLIVPH
jgi:hypothetical protein